MAGPELFADWDLLLLGVSADIAITDSKYRFVFPKTTFYKIKSMETKIKILKNISCPEFQISSENHFTLKGLVFSTLSQSIIRHLVISHN